jgi:DNA-binding transcriptional ArsR family regulator
MRELFTERRLEILRLIRKEPGLCTRELAQRVGVGWDSADYHARRLARAGVIVRERAPRKVLHFARMRGPSEAARRWAALPPSTRTTLRLLETAPDSCVLELLGRCNLHDGGLRWALDVALKLGLVEARRFGRRHYYRLSAAGLELVRAAATAPRSGAEPVCVQQSVPSESTG